MINSKINILSTEIENRNIINSGYGKSGYISQLFNIFKNNNIFCITEEKKEIWEICGNIYINKPNYHNVFIIIDDGNINLTNINKI